MEMANKIHDVNRPVGAAVNRYYRPELDCLRFFAFFAVFTFHSPGGDAAYFSARHIPLAALVASVTSAGRFGVDLFFLLSAYLITELLLREQKLFGRLDLRSFYVRRILRIWPLYFFGLLIGVLLAFLDPRQSFPAKYAVAFVLMLGNWLPFFGVYVDSVMGLLWTVSVEEQFYLLWPWFMSKARQGRTLLYASGGLLLVAMVSRILLVGHARALSSELPLSINTLARLDPFALGIATGVLMHNADLALGWAARGRFFATGCAIWLIAGHFRFHGLSTGFLVFGYPAVAVGAWFIFRAALGAGIAPRRLRYLGKISYGLYVFHEFALYCAAKLLGGVHTLRAFIVYWPLGLSLTVLMAALSYRFLESPFLALKERFAHVQSRPI